MTTMQGERRLYVAWRDPETRHISPVGLLIQRATGSLTMFTFGYLKAAESLDRFQVLPGFPDLHRRYNSRSLFPVFANRVMPRERPDYGDYVERLNLDVEADPFEVLGRSTGSRATDRIEVFPCPERAEDGQLSCLFFARGIHHLEGAAEAVDLLQAGDALRLVDEPENEVNPRALLLHARSGEAVGYAPDYLVEFMHDLREFNDSDPEVLVVHVNPRDAAPHLRLLCRVSGSAPADYSPFAGPEFQPLVDLSDDGRSSSTA
jgi:hypothetical protein